MKFISAICILSIILKSHNAAEIPKIVPESSNLEPGVYRVIGAEGSASLTALSQPSIPDQPDSLKKVGMTAESGQENQEWVLIPINETLHYRIINNAVDDNVLSLVGSKVEEGTEYTCRKWDITQLDNKNWQIRSVESLLCLSRLGLTVYHEGSDCDKQAQSQQWMFIKLRE